MTTTSNDNESFPEIQLCTIHSEDGRKIAYSSTKNESDHSVLFFYPGGGNRRMLLSLVRKLPKLRLVCINRPQKGETSPPTKKHSHLETVIHDAVVVLDSLGIDRVSVLCMCAGTPFAMAFCSQHKERTTGHFIGISSWVQPADCGYKNTKVSHYLATLMPATISPVAGSVMSSLGFSLTSFPTSWIAGALKMKLNDSEAEVFDEMFPNGYDDFGKIMNWMQQEKGGESADIKVLVNAGMIDYQQLGNNLQSITLWHGTEDTMVPHAGAEWLEEHVPGATLHTILDATHDGCNFLLYPSIVDSIQSLRQT